MKTRVQAHCCYKLLYHLVFIPKYRHRLLKSGVGSYCEQVILGVISDKYEDVIIEEVEVMDDHVHILITIPPKYAILDIVKNLKADSSRIMRKKFDFLKRGGREAMWSVGFFISSVGLNETMIKNYVRHQREQDEGQLVEL